MARGGRGRGRRQPSRLTLAAMGGGRPRREQPQRGVGAPPATHLLQVESPCEGPLQPTGARALAAGLWRGGVGVVCVCVCECE
jgi:hypothetical protein